MNDVQREILYIAQEECAEVTQAISKTFRFGMVGSYQGLTNKQRLEEELGDLMCMINMMMENDLVDQDEVLKFALKKKDKLRMWSPILSKVTMKVA
jgi:NTP pyrophosphatase (non-canonical NTP hydrolase)